MTNPLQNPIAVAGPNPWDQDYTDEISYPLFATDGSVSAPSYSFASQTTLGFYKAGTNQITATVGGVAGWSLNANGPGSTLANELSATGSFAWSSAADPNALADLFILRDAANTLAQRNGANAQAFRLYNTFTDVNNYERGEIAWVANELRFRTAIGGTGTNRNISIDTGNPNGNIVLRVNGTAVWQVSTTGTLIASTDNTIDIGASGATRPRNIYAGTGFLASEAANGKQGTAVLVGGTKVVSNTSVTANSRIFLTSQVDGGTPGFVRVSARTPGTSFTITSSSGTDTSTIAYEIFEPA